MSLQRACNSMATLNGQLWSESRRVLRAFESLSSVRGDMIISSFQLSIDDTGELLSLIVVVLLFCFLSELVKNTPCALTLTNS